jgi:hypothetical protein
MAGEDIAAARGEGETVAGVADQGASAGGEAFRDLLEPAVGQEGAWLFRGERGEEATEVARALLQDVQQARLGGGQPGRAVGKVREVPGQRRAQVGAWSRWRKRSAMVPASSPSDLAAR